MKKALYKNKTVLLYLIALILVSLPFRLYNFTYPLLDSFNFRQTQTATFALNFYKSGIDFFHTELDIFGIGPERYLLLEFPLYEALVAALYKIFFVNVVWGRIVSILAGFIGAFYLHQITYLVTANKKAALYAALFFLFVPLNMFYHRAFMIDPTIIAFLLAGSFYFLKYSITSSSRFFLLAVLFLSLGFLQKGLYGPFWLIPLTVYWLKNKSFRSLFRIDFIFLIAVPLFLLFLFQSYENRHNITYNHAFFTTGSPAHQEWNLGTLEDRFSLSLWQFRLKEILNGTMLKPGFILFIIGLLSVRTFDKYFFISAFLFSQILYFLILFRIQTQNYYQLVMIPSISILMSVGLVKVSALFRDRLSSAIIISLFFVFFIAKSWLNTLPSFYIDWNWYQTMTQIGTLLPENSYGIFATPGYDWNSAYSYYLGKKLLNVTVEDINQKEISLWQKEGYSFLIIYDENKSLTRLKELGIPDNLDLLADYPEIYHRNNIRIYRI